MGGKKHRVAQRKDKHLHGLEMLVSLGEATYIMDSRSICWKWWLRIWLCEVKETQKSICKVQFPFIHGWYMGKWLTFVHESCILQLCYNFLLVQGVFCCCCYTFQILYIENHVVCKKKKESFISPFPNCISFISISCLTALTRTSSTMLTRSVRHNNLAFPIILVGKFQVSHH